LGRSQKHKDEEKRVKHRKASVRRFVKEESLLRCVQNRFDGSMESEKDRKGFVTESIGSQLARRWPVPSNLQVDHKQLRKERRVTIGFVVALVIWGQDVIFGPGV